MRSRVTSSVLVSLILPISLTSLCFVCGCNEEPYKTGTTVTRPAGADEAQKRSMEHMKSIMKNIPKSGGR
jgi:hypothetical protein